MTKQRILEACLSTVIICFNLYYALSILNFVKLCDMHEIYYSKAKDYKTIRVHYHLSANPLKSISD